MSKHKISNWQQYKQALVQRGSLTIWMDEQAIQQWHYQTHHGRRGRGFHYSDTTIEIALMLKGLFKLPLRALEGFINSLFQLMAEPLQSPDYSSISKRAKTVDIKYRLPSQGPVTHLVILDIEYRSPGLGGSCAYSSIPFKRWWVNSLKTLCTNAPAQAELVNSFLTREIEVLADTARNKGHRSGRVYNRFVDKLEYLSMRVNHEFLDSTQYLFKPVLFFN